jgi:hypothetical protein
MALYECHGWIVLQETTRFDDESGVFEQQERFAPVVEEIRGLIRELNWGVGVLTLDSVFDMRVVHVTIRRNRRTPQTDDLERLLALINRRAPGSYGVLYVFDDENEVEWPGCNAFEVWVIARGKCERRGDPFLSPRAPVIQDELP